MMRSSFDSQLRQLNNELNEMGALCEEAINLSAKALAEGSAKIAGGVAPIDNEIDKMERDIETLCLKLLLRTPAPATGALPRCLPSRNRGKSSPASHNRGFRQSARRSSPGWKQRDH